MTDNSSSQSIPNEKLAGFFKFIAKDILASAIYPANLKGVGGGIGKGGKTFGSSSSGGGFTGLIAAMRLVNDFKKFQTLSEKNMSDVITVSIKSLDKQHSANAKSLKVVQNVIKSQEKTNQSVVASAEKGLTQQYNLAKQNTKIASNTQKAFFTGLNNTQKNIESIIRNMNKYSSIVKSQQNQNYKILQQTTNILNKSNILNHDIVKREQNFIEKKIITWGINLTRTIRASEKIITSISDNTSKNITNSEKNILALIKTLSKDVFGKYSEILSSFNKSLRLEKKESAAQVKAILKFERNQFFVVLKEVMQKEYGSKRKNMISDDLDEMQRNMNDKSDKRSSTNVFTDVTRKLNTNLNKINKNIEDSILKTIASFDKISSNENVFLDKLDTLFSSQKVLLGQLLKNTDNIKNNNSTVSDNKKIIKITGITPLTIKESFVDVIMAVNTTSNTINETLKKQNTILRKGFLNSNTVLDKLLESNFTENSTLNKMMDQHILSAIKPENDYNFSTIPNDNFEKSEEKEMSRFRRWSQKKYEDSKKTKTHSFVSSLLKDGLKVMVADALITLVPVVLSTLLAPESLAIIGTILATAVVGNVIKSYINDRKKIEDDKEFKIKPNNKQTNIKEFNAALNDEFSLSNKIRRGLGFGRGNEAAEVNQKYDENILIDKFAKEHNISKNTAKNILSQRHTDFTIDYDNKLFNNPLKSPNFKSKLNAAPIIIQNGGNVVNNNSNTPSTVKKGSSAPAATPLTNPWENPYLYFGIN